MRQVSELVLWHTSDPFPGSAHPSSSRHFPVVVSRQARVVFRSAEKTIQVLFSRRSMIEFVFVLTLFDFRKIVRVRSVRKNDAHTLGGTA
jgi:hypothetical protein